MSTMIKRSNEQFFHERLESIIEVWWSLTGKSLGAMEACCLFFQIPWAASRIKTYKGFLEFYVRNTPCQIKGKPTTETVENFRRDFETALARMRDFCVPKAMSITMKRYAFLAWFNLSTNQFWSILYQIWRPNWVFQMLRCPEMDCLWMIWPFS